LHHIIPVHGKWILKAVEIPVLKQSQIKAHVRTREPVITTNKRKEGVEMPYIVHTARFLLVIEFASCFRNFQFGKMLIKAFFCFLFCFSAMGSFALLLQASFFVWALPL
jgi:hypothetical protein